MERLSDVISVLPRRHQAALMWFVQHSGEDCTWPKPLNGPDGRILLASRAKGIYKPSWTKYALSIRQILNSPYPDREPTVRPDGTWSYFYFQENKDPAARDKEYTNRALVQCWYDKVPVGVMRQTKGKPNVRYRVLGVALVSGWDSGYFILEGFAPSRHVRDRRLADEVARLVGKHEHSGIERGIFNPLNITDGRERAVAYIVLRRGQPEFRNKLLKAYGGRCAISDCDAVEALEAAHILPYCGSTTNHVSNGLLLRADLHTLFDLGLITIDPVTLTVLLAPSLIESSYGDLAGKPIRLPLQMEDWPSVEALQSHRDWSGL